MSGKIEVVQNDTRPNVVINMTDKFTDLPIDISGTTVVVKLRIVGTTAIKETLVCTLLPGLLQDDGSISTTAPYNTPGKGGRFVIVWSNTALNTAADMEAEIVVTYGDGTVQTNFDILKIKVRSAFG